MSFTLLFLFLWIVVTFSIHTGSPPTSHHTLTNPTEHAEYTPNTPQFIPPCTEIIYGGMNPQYDETMIMESSHSSIPTKAYLLTIQQINSTVPLLPLHLHIQDTPHNTIPSCSTIVSESCTITQAYSPSEYHEWTLVVMNNNSIPLTFILQNRTIGRTNSASILLIL